MNQNINQSKGHFRTALSRLFRKKIAVICIAILIIIYFSGIFAFLIAPYEYTAQDYSNIKKPQIVEHWMRTDLAAKHVFSIYLWFCLILI